NRVLVTKPHNKTPYELLHGRPPSIRFRRPFGCPVTILNTLDPLGKFDRKANEGFVVGYSINSKAFRVFNTRTRKVEENLHITFLENKPNLTGSGPDWLFDIDLLTNSMNYEPVTIGNQTNRIASIKDNVDAVPTQQYILLQLLSDSLQSSEDAVADDTGKKTTEEPANEGERNGYDNSTNRVSTICPSVSATGQSFVNTDDLPTDPFMPDLEDTIDLLNTGIFSGAYADEDVGVEAYLNNLETTMNVSPIPTTRIHKDHPKYQIIEDINPATQTRRMTKISKEHAMVSYINKQRRTNHKDYQNCLFACFLSQKEPKKVIQALADPSWVEAMLEELLQFRLQKVWTLVDLPNGYTQEEGIDYDEVFSPVARIEAIMLFLAYALFMGFIVYQIDVKSAFLYGTIEEEVAWYKTLSTYLLENRFRRGTIDKTLFIKKDKDDAQEIPDEFYGGAHFLLRVVVKIASTPIETNKALLKDEEVEDVDVHLYRSMIGSLMYLTASSPDIMFTFCACARDSPFDLEAFSDSDYAGASLDRKSITGGFGAAGQKLFVDQHNMVACLERTEGNANFHQIVDFLNASTIMYSLTISPTIYASYIEQFWSTTKTKIVNNGMQIHAKVDGNTIVISKSSVRSNHHFNDEDGVTSLTNYEILENLALMGYEIISDKLTFQKSFFSLQWKYLIHTILHCLSLKSTAWNEFSTNIASVVICLANNQKFLQLFLNNQVKSLAEPFNDTYETPKRTQKVFANIRRKGKSFSGTVTPLFQSMLAIQAVEGEGSGQPSEPQPTPSPAPSSHEEQVPTVATSHPHKTQTPRQAKRGRNTKIPQSGGPPKKVGDEAVHKELGDRVERVATTAASLDAEELVQVVVTDAKKPWEGTIAQTRSERVPTSSYDSPLLGGNTPGSDEGRLNIKELMAICTNLSNKVFALETSRTSKDLVIRKLKKKVRRLKKKLRARTPVMKLFKIGTSRRKSLVKENVSKHGRNLKTRQMFEEGDFNADFDDIDDMVNEAMENVEGDTVNAGGVVNTATTGVSADSASVTTAGVSIIT
ncbi:putative ribonuclease H-like domain-containing protein, partial [Tanacetum coccineum]